jgi:DNA polymerase V
MTVVLSLDLMKQKLWELKWENLILKQKILLLKNKVEVFSSNYSLYGDLSRRVMRTLKRFNTEIEVYSIDEAFIDLSNFPDQDIEKVGKEIRETVLKWTGIPTSIGIAKTKTLSKIANHIAKKKNIRCD